MSEQINRETVSVGIDFRPIPIDMGDGQVWMFDPDPTPGKWSGLSRALTAFGRLNVTADSSEEEVDAAAQDMESLTTGLTDSIAELLVDIKQRKAFRDRGYSTNALQRLAKVLIQTLSGFPTS